MQKITLYLLFLCLLSAFTSLAQQTKKPYLYVLGTLQDGGMPHLGCSKEHCTQLLEHPDPSKKVVSLGLVLPRNKETYLFEATPDIVSQVTILQKEIPNNNSIIPNGIFITHAHLGHYTGLAYLGKEALGAKNVKVFAMPKMEAMLKKNTPWDLLVQQNNIALYPIDNEQEITLKEGVTIIPILVPHRDERSETVGYKIVGPQKTALFIPDINKWNLWEKDFVKEIERVDYAFIDATFFDAEEIGYRDLSQIPHPFVVETINILDPLPAKQKNKIYFIHLNHTNPLLNPASNASILVKQKGYRVAKFGNRFPL